METKLRFTYTNNRFINFGDGERHEIPMKIVERSLANGHTIQVPEFDMDHVHQMDLHAEVAIEPDREDYGSERGFDEAVNDAYAIARENRKLNKSILFVVDAHVEAGNIKIVSDPFPLRHKAKGNASKSAPVEKPTVEVKKANAKSK